MTRKVLAESIAETVADYREGQIETITPARVEKWVRQFPKEARDPILEELDHVLSRTYISRSDFNSFLESVVTADALAGSAPRGFWKRANILRIQQKGDSQKVILAMFEKALSKKAGLRLGDCGSAGGPYFYFDDCTFTATHVRWDLVKWVKEKAPKTADVHIVTSFLHSGRIGYTDRKVTDEAAAVGKKVTVQWWRIEELSDTSANGDTECLHPIAFPEDDRSVQRLMQALANLGHPARIRTTLTTSANKVFSGEAGRQILEQEFLKAGARIKYDLCPNLTDNQLEALRVGADAFASDLNPIPVLLNKVVLEYIPKFGQKLADEVRKWGKWIKEQAEKELAKFYPPDPDGSTPIAYLWARTILSEAPSQGAIPVEVPLMRSLWLAKKATRRRALRWVRNAKGEVQTESVDVAYVEDGQRVVKRVRRPLLEIFEPAKESEVAGGTVARGSATCPVTGFTTKVDRVRAQLKTRRGGAADARLFCVVSTRSSEQGRFYRLPLPSDQAAFASAAAELERREKDDGTSRARIGRRESEGIESGQGSRRSLVPDEVISLNELRRVSVPIYGMQRWGDLFSPRQALALTTLARLVREAGERLASLADAGLAEAIITVLGIAHSRFADICNSFCVWESSKNQVRHMYTRQALGMLWDFAEPGVFSDAAGNFSVTLGTMIEVLVEEARSQSQPGHIKQASATHHPLPDDSVAAFISDPPYYDAVPYAYLSDFFYVWMRRTLADVHPALFREAGVPKDAEIVVDRPHQLSKSTKGIVFYERELTKAFAEGRRITRPDGIGTIVFASKTTASWEAILKAVIDAGWVITGSWPIDTEMETRVAAQGQARLASSVHLVCRPRETPDGVVLAEVGDWRDVLSELPQRMHEWMPRLVSEGVVGADAIFACLGPALEIYSRYSRVEKANGDPVLLKEYLEHVWAVVSKEALSTIFRDADASGLEPDARITAMWLWTVGGGSVKPNGKASAESEDDDEGADEEVESSSKKVTTSGFSLEFDAARKIAQGLGIHLERSESIVEVKGDKARLLGVAERTKHLFGKDADAGPAPKKKKPKELSLFDALGEAEEAEGGWKELKGPPPGTTVLDRVHQAMILFGAQRGELLKRFLVEDGAGKDARFWKLAQSLAALYPTGTDERRWVEGVLARKKGLGL